MHEQCHRNSNGSLVIPPDLVQRWERQIKTPYKQLPEAEKSSDRKAAEKIISAFEKRCKSSPKAEG
jgi:hypothetical protein